MSFLRILLLGNPQGSDLSLYPACNDVNKQVDDPGQICIYDLGRVENYLFCYEFGAAWMVVIITDGIMGILPTPLPLPLPLPQDFSTQSI